jgi:flagellar export protein FliJ
MRPRQVHQGGGESITRGVYGPSFRFRLERVRTVRKHGEQIAQQELAGALGRRDDCAAALAEASEAAGGARDRQLEAAERLQSALDLQSHQAWIERTQQAQQTVAESLRRHEREVDHRRGQLTAAARDVKALDRLEARRRGEFNRDAARREAFATDEVALNVFRGNAA